ncbi:transketolase [Nematocida sp. AWRm80]|nr:transketolase [Nematocida sp. AWRm80]
MDTETNCVNELRVLVAEMVEKAKSGHPGGPMGIAPVMHLLYSRLLRVTTKEPKWLNRDIFVLSNGHCCGILYACLSLTGFLLFEELKKFRTLESSTPGHPEYSECIESTTGPLGQGIAQAIGYAIALKNMTRFNTDEYQLFTNRVYCMLGDGCFQEGISSEALSLAGHLALDNLTLIYDYNQITIDGPLSLSGSENVVQKMTSLGYHVIEQEETTDLNVLHKTLSTTNSKPVFILLHTTIAKDSLKEGSHKTHGAPLGKEDIQHLKQKYQILQDPSTTSQEEYSFYVSEQTKEIYRRQREKIDQEYSNWQLKLEKYKDNHPDLYQILMNNKTHKLEDIFDLKEYKQDRSTREHLHSILSVLGKYPRVFGGSADLAPSNLTLWDNAVVFDKNHRDGTYLHYGVREHAMCGISNGIAAYGWHRVFGSTFLNFVTYGFPSIRIAALSSFPVTIFATHDSIALGEDGPTHQPIEVFPLIRATPNLILLRPADGTETLFSVVYSLMHSDVPCVVALTRQKVPALENTSVSECFKGGYILSDYRSNTSPRILLVATGSEVSLALQVKDTLEDYNIRVVSLLSTELFDSQPMDYQHSILSSDLSFSIEAQSTLGWHKYVKYPIGIDTFGASAPGDIVYRHFKFTKDHIIDKILSAIRE